MVLFINTIKIIFLLGFLVFIHEGGHFLVAKLCKVKVNEFAIGFGKILWQKQGKETKYSLRMIPLGGFCNMEGEEEESDAPGSFSKASIPKRIAIVAAGGLVNILFAIILYVILVTVITGNFITGLTSSGDIINAMWESIKLIFTGGVTADNLVGPIGISEIVAQTTGLIDFFYIMAIISLSLGVTNLLPIPALEGGKILILIIEIIRRKPMKMETEAKIQMLGFSILIALSLFVTYNDILRIGAGS